MEVGESPECSTDGLSFARTGKSRGEAESDGEIGRRWKEDEVLYSQGCGVGLRCRRRWQHHRDIGGSSKERGRRKKRLTGRGEGIACCLCMAEPISAAAERGGWAIDGDDGNRGLGFWRGERRQWVSSEEDGWIKEYFKIEIVWLRFNLGVNMCSWD